MIESKSDAFNIQELRSKNDELIKKNNQLNNYIIKLEAENARLKNDYSTIENSTSWRITYPLRRVCGSIKKLIHLLIKVVLSLKNMGIRFTVKKISQRLYRMFISKERKYAPLIYTKGEPVVVVATKHTLFVANLIANCCRNINTPVSILTEQPSKYDDCLHIVIAPQLLSKLPKRYIAFQMEQTISSRWLTSKYYSVLRNAHYVFDYSTKNIAFFKENTDFGSRFYYLPIDYLPNFYSVKVKQEYEVVFYGDINNVRRKRIIEQLSQDFNVKVISEVFGDELYYELNKAKIIVNIHYYENAMLETTRLYECLSVCNAILISEDSCDTIEDVRLKDLVDFVPTDDIDALRQRIAYWLNSEELRKDAISKRAEILKKKHSGFEYFFYRFMLANDWISFDEFYNLAGSFVEFNTNRVCLSLPEQVDRRKEFDADNRLGFEVFPGLRHIRGWTGCGLSYKFIMRKAEEQGFDTILVCEDDVFFPEDFDERFDECEKYLLKQGTWDVFQGIMAEIGDVTISKTVHTDKQVFVHLNHMMSMVFNYYNKSVFPYFIAWDEMNDDVYSNTIDRALGASDLDIIVTAPFLVGHKEELISSIWGFENTQYSDLISNSSKRILKLVEDYESKMITN